MLTLSPSRASKSAIPITDRSHSRLGITERLSGNAREALAWGKQRAPNLALANSVHKPRFVVPCGMPRKLTGHEQDVLATLVQHMGNPLDEFDMDVGDHIERIVREGNYKKMHAGRYRAALKAQGSALG